MSTPRIITSCLIFNEANELLLLQRHHLARGGGYWAPPGGKPERGESLEAAIIREVREETGIDVAMPRFLGCHDVHMPHGSARMATFISDAPAGLRVVLNADEHEAHAWHELSALPKRELLIWGLPTILHDFGLIVLEGNDPTLGDESRIEQVVESA